MNKISKISLFIAVSFFLALGAYTVLNFHNLSAPFGNYIHNNVSLDGLKTEITDILKSDELFQKDAFINLNGLYGRLSGRRLYNDVILMKDGMLAAKSSGLGLKPDFISETIGILRDFDSFVSERGGHFVYVQFPAKYSSDNAMMPDGLSSSMYRDTESFTESLREAGIEVIDTLPLLAETSEDIEKNYYATDHHWKPSAAFLAFQEIMAHLRKFFPDGSFDEMILDPGNWTIHEIPDQFLGSTGKRVGLYFTKLDTLQWLIPDFETELSFYIPQLNNFYYGDYESVFIRSDYQETGGNKLHTNHYAIYGTGDYPLTISKNARGCIGGKVLLIKDSFSLPLITYLSLVFREVDVIDPRKFTESSLAEYVDKTRPDIVMMAVNSSVIKSDNYFSFFGEDDEFLSENKNLLLNDDLRIEQRDAASNWSAFYEGFSNHQYYTISVPGINVTDGTADGFTLALYDNKSGRIVSEYVMDINYCNTFGNCEWTFKTPDAGAKNMSLLFYAGLRGKTNSVGLEFEDVKLYKRSLVND